MVTKTAIDIIGETLDMDNFKVAEGRISNFHGRAIFEVHNAYYAIGNTKPLHDIGVRWEKHPAQSTAKHAGTTLWVSPKVHVETPQPSTHPHNLQTKLWVGNFDRSVAMVAEEEVNANGWADFVLSLTSAGGFTALILRLPRDWPVVKGWPARVALPLDCTPLSFDPENGT